jgi:hypothetical protein
MNKLFYLVLATLLMSGCGAEIAYKQGASARDLQANKAACQQATTEAALHQCLEDNGWAVQKLGEQWLSDDDLFATASVSESNQMPTAVKKTEGLKTTDSIKSEDTTKEASVATATKPQTTAVKSETQTEIKPDVKTEAKPITIATNVKPQHNILDTYEIKSWWKMGGGAALLDQNMEECTAALGEAHKPNKVTFTFTRGFAICMREKGWRGLISQNK